jgi:diguanylate cyclase (GGDEF)-like protein
MAIEQMPAENEPMEMAGEEVSPREAELQGLVLLGNALLTVYEGKDISSKAEIEELRQENQKLYDLAYKDSLTAVDNRRSFYEAAERRKAESASGAVLMYVDPDKFKPINDRLGHAAGDAVLQGIARNLESLARPGDRVARLGGDEFGVLFTNTTEEELKERFKDGKIEFSVQYNDEELEISLSVGFATYQEGEDVKTLVDRADAAMLAVKKKNGDGR